jgi:O-acetyl-ADP-ribose deacetylase (regulator of RNase III)
MTDAWRSAFDNCSDVEVSCGDILGLDADVIVSPANSFGFMDGGIDLAYSRHFGWNLQKNLQKIIRDKYYGELPVGNAVIVETGNPAIRYLISAPTMRIPQDVSETVNAYLAFRAVLIVVKEFNEESSSKIKSILCPGLGTLTGRIAPETCATQMKKAYDLILKGTLSFPNSLSEAYDMV